MATCEKQIIETGKDQGNAIKCFACIKSKLNAGAVQLCKDCDTFYCNSCMNKHDDLFQRRKMSYEMETDKRGIMGTTLEANLSEKLVTCQRITESSSKPKGSLQVPQLEGASGENIHLGKCDLHPTQDLNAFCEDDEMLCCDMCKKDHRDLLSFGRECTFVQLPLVAKVFRHDAEFSNLPLKLKDMLTLLEKTMLELTEEEKIVERNADAVKMTIKDCSDTIARLINKLQDQTFEAVEIIKTTITKDIATQKKLCESLYAKLESICNVVAVERVDDTTAFIGLTKGKTLLSSARELFTDTEARLRCGIEFHTDKELHKMLSQMQYFGTVNSIERKFVVTEKSEVNITLLGDTTPRCDITAMCELPNGMLVLVDAANSKLKLFNESFQHPTQSELTSPPLDMCVIGESELAVVTCGKVHFYILKESKLQPEKSIKISDQSTGIAYFDCNLFVARKTALYTYSLDGKINKRIYKDGAAGRKVTISRCAIGRCGKYIYLTGPDCQGLLILDISGKRLAFIKHDDPFSPQGLHVASGGQVFVCGTGSQTVLQLDRERSRLVMVADGDNGLSSPRCVVLSNRKSCLIIGQEATEKILVFRFT